MNYPNNCDICGQKLPRKPTPVLGGAEYNDKIWCMKCYNGRHKIIELEGGEWKELVTYLEVSLKVGDYDCKNMEIILKQIKEQSLKR